MMARWNKKSKSGLFVCLFSRTLEEDGGQVGRKRRRGGLGWTVEQVEKVKDQSVDVSEQLR